MPATFDSYKFIRDIWPSKAIAEQILKRSPALGLMPKDTNFSEKIRYVTIGTGGGQGLGSTYGEAKEAKTNSTAAEFQVRTRPYYGTVSVPGELWRRYELTGTKGPLVDFTARESKNLLAEAQNDFSSYIHGNGGGAIGRLTSGSSVSGQTFTLDKDADVRRIRRGMRLQFAATDGTTGSVKPGYVTVASVGGVAGARTVTVVESTIATGIPTAAASDYIFRYSTFGAVPYGFDAWCPEHTGSPAAFLGVTRSDDAEKLAGICMTATVKSPRQRIMEASQYQADGAGADGDLVYLTSTRNWGNLYNELASANSLHMMKAPAAPVGKLAIGVTYNAIEIIGAGGPIKVCADPWMPDNVERLLDMSQWKLSSTGEMLHWDAGSTPGAPRVEDGADSRELRLVGDIATECWNPWANVRVKVGS